MIMIIIMIMRRVVEWDAPRKRARRKRESRAERPRGARSRAGERARRFGFIPQKLDASLRVPRSSASCADSWATAVYTRTPEPLSAIRTLRRLAKASASTRIPFGDHPFKLERRREDQHGPCARMTRAIREE